ncbi:MAG: 50S ribosomal protein L17 [Candidatus Omnitrophica bacterium]|nr:50S ribosomal protein L17 [Candidatus Omnitrophota bacterium]
MRHKKYTAGRLGRMPNHRDATVRALTIALFTHQRIRTTDAKAKVLRSLAEKLITLGKRGDLSSRRRAIALLHDKAAVAKLFNKIGPLFKDRQSGYTRIIRFDRRMGDGAHMSLIELTEKEHIEPKVKKKGKKGKGEEVVAIPAKELKKTEAPKEPKHKAKKETEPVKAEEKPKKAEAKSAVEQAKSKLPEHEKKPSRERRDKGFFKGLRGFLKRKAGP